MSSSSPGRGVDAGPRPALGGAPRRALEPHVQDEEATACRHYISPEVS